MYVIVDPNDNGVTLSRALFNHIKRNAHSDETPKVFVFRISNSYAFAINPPLDNRPTVLADIQYNSKYRCIGFEALCPTVGRILYDYGLPEDAICKLSVTVQQCNNLTYYLIEHPHEKFNRKYSPR